MSHYAQIQNPVNKEWHKLDRRTGRIVANSETMFAGIELLQPRSRDVLRPHADTLLSRGLERVLSELRHQHDSYDTLMEECRRVEDRIEELTVQREELERPLSADTIEPRKKLPVERVAAAFGSALYGDGRPWGSFDERERDAMKRGAHAALKEAHDALADSHQADPIAPRDGARARP